MLGFKLSFNTARLGKLCTAIALLALVTGCPFLNPDACRNNPCNDNDPCTDNVCTDVEDEAVCDYPAKDCGDGVCDPANGNCEVCVTDADCDGVCNQAADPNTCVDCLTDENCDDSNSCTDNQCCNGTCQYRMYKYPTDTE